MKKLLMLLLIFFAGILSPDIFSPKAEAQVKRERVVKRKKVRKVRRRTRRRVRRRVTRRAHYRYRSLPKYRAVVATAPSAAVVITKGGATYRYHKGIFYNKGPRGFVVVRPVRGVRIRALPVGHRTVVVSGANYYYYYGTFYTSVSQNEYEVVDAPEGAVVDALPEGYEVLTKNDQEYYSLDGVYYQEVDAEEYDDKVGYQVVVL